MSFRTLISASRSFRSMTVSSGLFSPATSPGSIMREATIPSTAAELRAGVERDAWGLASSLFMRESACSTCDLETPPDSEARTGAGTPLRNPRNWNGAQPRWRAGPCEESVRTPVPAFTLSPMRT